MISATVPYRVQERTWEQQREHVSCVIAHQMASLYLHVGQIGSSDSIVINVDAQTRRSP